MELSSRVGACFLILILLLIPAGLAGQGTIVGRVVDGETLQPLSSVQVHIPQLAIGALSGPTGTYQLTDVPAGTHTVVAQRLGSRPAERAVTVGDGATAQLDFTLESQALALDEVIVTGTPGGTQRRAIGNVVDRVELASEIEARPITSMEQALSAAAPGINLLSTPSEVGGGSRIRLRGSSSASLPGDPVIFIDGVRMYADQTVQGGTETGDIHSSFSRLSDIDPSDIESIEIIKGPAAATLYGTDAANGVIQIITKRGAVGSARLDASMEIGASWAPLLSTPDYWFMRPDGRMARINMVELEPHFNIPENPYAGDPLKQTGISQSYGISAQGGSETTRYYLSFNRRDAEGTWRNSYDIRNSVRGSFAINPHETLSADLNLSTMWGKVDGGRELEGTGTFGDQIFSGAGVRAYQTNLADPRRGWRSSMPEGQHPAAFQQLLEVGRNTASLTLTHQPFEWLTNRLVVGRDDVFEQESILSRKDAFLATFCCNVNAEGQKDVNTYNVRTSSLDLSGSVNVNPTERLNSVTSYGLQYYNLQRKDIRVSGSNFATPPLSTVGAAGERTGTEDWLENTTMGVFIQQQFGWENRIFVTGAVRADDSSAFGNEFTWAIYPKFSATWVVHEEPWYNVGGISQLRLRTAWGAAGQQPDLVAASRLYRPVAGPDGSAAVAPLSFGNPNLGPERGEELEVGFDIEFLDGRIGGTFTRYWRKTTDGILASPLSPSVGYGVATTNDSAGSEYFANLGEISAWGTETTIDWRVIDREPLDWDLNFSFTTMGNRVDSLGDTDRIPVPRARDHVVGYQLASIFEKRIVSAQFVEGTHEVINLMCDGGVPVEGKALPMQGGAAVPCEEAPEVFWGVAEPTRMATLSSRFTLFGNLQLSMLMDYKGGHWANHEYLALRQTSYPANQLAYLQDDPVGVGYLSHIHRNALAQTRSGFARLQEIQLSYNLPQRYTDRMSVDRARVSLGMSNVGILWQAQSHVEREPLMDLDSNRADQTFGGETRGQLGYRQVTMGLNVSF